MYGFAKNEMANIDPLELQEYQKLARMFVYFSEADIVAALEGGELQEVNDNG